MVFLKADNFPSKFYPLPLLFVTLIQGKNELVLNKKGEFFYKNYALCRNTAAYCSSIMRYLAFGLHWVLGPCWVLGPQLGESSYSSEVLALLYLLTCVLRI